MTEHWRNSAVDAPRAFPRSPTLGRATHRTLLVLASPGCGASACRVPFGEGVTLPILAAEDLAVFKVVFDRWRDWTDIEEMLTRNVAARATVRRVVRRDQRGGTPRFEEPKTARSRRTMPLSPVHVVSARVGHASARMTLDAYAHAMPADESEALSRLEAVLFGRGE